MGYSAAFFLRRLVAIVIALLLCAPARGAQDARALEPGQPVERELAGGQSHVYQLKLGAGQHLEAVIEQRGIDLVATLNGPDGKRLAQFDNDGRNQGRETILRVVEAGGDYQLVVEAKQRAAPAGRYRIEIVALRAATTRDRALEQARQLSAEAARLTEAGKFNDALPMAERAVTLREEILGAEHADLALALYQLANLHRRRADFAKAEPLAQRALAMAEKTYEPNHPSLGLIVNELAVISFNKADLVRAEPLFERARSIWEQGLGPNHPNVGRVINNLAALHFRKGETAKVEPLLLRALAILEQELGPEHTRVADAVNNLGNFYTDRGEIARAEPFRERALRIWEKQLGAEHQQVGNGLNNLASLRYFQRELAQAETLYSRALAIFEKTVGPEHPDSIRTLVNLASLRAARGDYTQAATLSQRVLTLREKVLGAEHPDVAFALNTLTRAYAASGDLTQAINAMSRACSISERNLALNFAVGSERQKLDFLATLVKETNRAISLHARLAGNDAAARELSLTTILRRKGRALDAMTDSIAALRRRATPEDQKLLDQLRETRAQLARLALGAPPRGVTPAEYQRRVRTFTEQREKLEAEISQRSAEFRAQAQPVTLAAVQAAIPAGAALVEFASYRPFNPRYSRIEDQFGQPRYVAYALRPGAEAEWVDLGEQQPIDEAIERLRQSLRDPKRRNVKALARAVDRLVMQPVRPLLGGSRRVFLAPDGALNLVPFAALVSERGQYLVSRYTFSYLSSGRDLLRPRTRPARSRSAMVVASPDFGETTGSGPASERVLKYRPGASGVVLAEAYFPPLPGTASEARTLKSLLPDAAIYTGAQATEALLKQVNGPRILHIATHGFFLGDETPAPESARSLNPAEDSPGGLFAGNPLLRSGLALAGANYLKSGQDDGILTALEAAGMDLSGTQLVALSACDTGVGEVKNGDGVYGLRRALTLAGAETQVMSLWPVSDRATRDLMIGYYRRLQRGEGRTDALREAQLRMLESRASAGSRSRPQRRTRDYSHPYYWASFIQSGEWTSLDSQP